MVRTAASPVLLATLLACGGGHVCHLDECGNSVCTDLQSDPLNCGMCGSACAAIEFCSAGICVGKPGSTCTPPLSACADACVDLGSDATNCGACGSACSTGVACVTSRCASPLVAMRTVSSNVNGTFGRDLFVLDDVTLGLVRIDTSTFATDRVIDQAVLGDGRVVYVAAQDTEGVFELYVAPPGGGAVTKLNPPLVAGGNVQAGVVVNGKTVVYRADQDTAGQVELYAVSADAPGVATKLNAALGAGARVSPVVAITDDGSKVAFVADQDTVGLDEAYLVAVAAPGVTTKLNAPVVDGVWDLQLSGDGRFVAYRNDDASSFNPQLFVVATSRPQFALHVENQLQPNYVAQDVYEIAGNELYYTGSTTFLEASLWSAPLGGILVPSQEIVAGGPSNDVRTAFEVDAAKSVIYFRQTELNGGASFRQLFEIATGGGSAVALSVAPTPVADFALSPDHKRLAFRSGGDGAEGGIINRGTAGPITDTSLAPAIDELDLTTMTGPVELGSDANSGIAAGYVLRDDGRCVFLGDLDVVGQQDAYLASGSADASVAVGPLLGSASGSDDATSVVALAPF